MPYYLKPYFLGGCCHPNNINNNNGVIGPTGPAPVFYIGTVTTLEPEQEATVNMTGDSTSGYILNFGIPKGQLNSTDRLFKGVYDTENDLLLSHPIGNLSEYAYIEESSSYWYWNNVLYLWVNQEISASDYLLLSEDARNSVPYLVV